ncbi:PREDICTED: uncharacterized protein LOC105145062 [Acromyrmex echinatior]|uniref:uncharacterized protein LOC105145062 n=1 Tax=Acromyrmex echinatior TaxID=103372 RepID=UPI000580C4C8|nr:PREDICTED: uncharacterized protein LOC105145062 [Acromyrmex echinatior]
MSADKLKNHIDSLQENSLNKKADSSTISEIIDKNNTKKFKTPSQKQENISNIDTNKKMQTKQNFDCVKHEEIAILSRCQSSKDYVTMVINNQMDSRYDRVKPVLLRVVNWFFGGCPEASKRHRKQTDKVEKEEIFESERTNTWLL